MWFAATYKPFKCHSFHKFATFVFFTLFKENFLQMYFVCFTQIAIEAYTVPQEACWPLLMDHPDNLPLLWQETVYHQELQNVWKIWKSTINV